MFVLDTGGYDVILGMSCPNRHHAVIDCRSRVVVFKIPLQREFSIIGESRVVNQSQRGKCIEMAGQRRAVFVEEEFSNVFSEESPRLPPDRMMEFTIDLIPGTTPIYKAFYRMAQLEVEILKAS